MAPYRCALVKLRPLLKKALVLVGFFSLDGFATGAGMLEGFATAVASAATAGASLASCAGLAGKGTLAARLARWLCVACFWIVALEPRFGGEERLDGGLSFDRLASAS